MSGRPALSTVCRFGADAIVWLAGDPAANIAEASGAFMPPPEEYLRHMMEAHPELRSFFEQGESEG